MSFGSQIQAVVQAPDDPSKFHCPWDVSKFEPFSWIRLSGEMTYQEIGLVFRQLIEYNQLELADDTQIVLTQVLEAESLVLPGGIQVVCDEKVIDPSCCCGLETWREWMDFLQTGESPWLGHDPSPWVEMQDDLVRVWSDGGFGLESVSNTFHISISRLNFEKALRQVERYLQTFLFCIDSWAQEVGFPKSTELSHKFNNCFNIKSKYLKC